MLTHMSLVNRKKSKKKKEKKKDYNSYIENGE